MNHMQRLAIVLLAMLALSMGVTSAQAQDAEIERHFGKQCYNHSYGAERHQACILTNMSDITGKTEGLAQLHPNANYDDAYRVYERYISHWRNNVRVKITNFYTWYSGRHGDYPSSLSTDWYQCSPLGQYNWFFSKHSYDLQWWPGGPVTGPYVEYSLEVPIYCAN